VANGTKEITLLGQNVNAYHGEGPDGKIWGLGRLLHHLAEIDGVERLRYTTSHPLDMDDDLIFAHRDIPALMPYLHLPVQAGSDHVLQAMNRRHTGDEYKRIIARMRDIVPNLALSGDFIVGFPGETDQDFADTLRLVDEVKYASAYSFKYSERPGTPAANSGDQIDEDVKSERLASLQQLLESQRFAFNKGCEGQEMSVLVEREGGRDGQMTGRSPFMQSVYFESDDAQIGQIMPMRVTEGRQNSLRAEIITPEIITS
jgi:tRNA-2-methylthio-N6-dimethylallyladenosine synthase